MISRASHSCFAGRSRYPVVVVQTRNRLTEVHWASHAYSHTASQVPAALLQPTVLTAVSPYLAADDLRATGANAMGSRHNIKRGHNADAPAAGKRAR